MPKIELIENEANDFSILIHRILNLKIDKELSIKLNIQLIIFKDEENSYYIEPEITDWNYVIYNNKRITGYENIQKFIKSYKDSTNLTKRLNTYINNMYKSYSNEDIIKLANEYNITI